MKTPPRLHRILRLVTLVLAGLVSACTSSAQSTNEKMTADAWAALNAGKFEEAIVKADACIVKFRGEAEALQEKLHQAKADIPVGAVTDDQKKKIHANGLLNDVATCYFIKGKAAEALARKEDARRAYEGARALSYARTWDPQGWFWSPAVGATEQLAALR